MADRVSRAKTQLRHARNERQERQAAFWQQAINEGRALRQARVEMQAGEALTPAQRQRQRQQRQTQ